MFKFTAANCTEVQLHHIPDITEKHEILLFIFIINVRWTLSVTVRDDSVLKAPEGVRIKGYRSEKL